LEWKKGMPLSIRELLPQHLTMIKQRIIEETLQYIIDHQDNETKNIYDTIKSLGSDITTTPPDVLDVKTYCVVAKIVDTTLNKFIEYALKHSISGYVYSMAKNNIQRMKLTNVDTDQVLLLLQKDYQKINLGSISKDIVEEIIRSSISYKIPQIELNPDNLEYATNPPKKNSNIIHYIYDFNYFSSNDFGDTNKCYKINTHNIEKLITPDNINYQNSDGKTPLHYAIEICHPEAVRVLVDHGANPRGWPNKYNKTPFQCHLDNLYLNMEILSGVKLNEILDKFSIPFNDLLQARLKDEKYNLNILKDITLGIPIQFLIYNQMFYMYLNNYRYGFTIELRDKVVGLIEKYFGNQFSDKINPTDLFETIKTTNSLEIKKIIQGDNLESNAKKSFNHVNKSKILIKNKEINEINNQLASLGVERIQINDLNQLNVIDDLQNQLTMKKVALETELSDLQYSIDDNVSEALVDAFKRKISNIIRQTAQRNLTPTDFYNSTFKTISNNPAVQRAIWKNYISRHLEESYSVILSRLFYILDVDTKYFQNQSVPPTRELDVIICEEINILQQFFFRVKDYIETKESLPADLEDNYILREEVNQIVYITNLILTPAIVSILQNHLYEGLKELNETDALLGSIKDVVNDIMTLETEGYNLTLIDYIYDVLSIKAVKYFGNIYNNSLDADRKTMSGADLFNPIIDTIKRSPIRLDENSLIIQNLKNYLIPFLVNSYQNFIFHIRLSVYGLEKYLLNTYQLVDILDTCCN